MNKTKQLALDETLTSWIEEEFRNANTKNSYRAALNLFKKTMKIKDLGEYLKSKPDVIVDLKKFLNNLKGRPSKTINTYVGAVKVFFRDHNLKVPENDWRKLRKRGFFPKRVKAETQDRRPSKSELKRILNHMNIKGRALVLFLISSGTRIGETLQLKVEDFQLDSDPPQVHIRAAYTKGGVGERIVYFSYEARDTLKDWVSVKNETTKRRVLIELNKKFRKKSKNTFNGDRMFPWSPSTAQFMWSIACDKAGLGTRDKRTNRRIYHLHTLRKFFRTNIGIELDYIHALMGHREYLDDAYLRLDNQGEIGRMYLSAMKNVTVYSANLSRKEEVKRALAMQGLTFDDILSVLGKEMYNQGIGTGGGGLGLRVPLDENYIASLEDQEIGKYALQALREKLLGHSTNEPKQKVINESSLESYLSKGWKYVNSLNNGSQKCIIVKG